MPKFSVKKPFTVFAAVVVIIVLGIVSYTSMTPTLIPNMDLPYVIVMTTYPGASPEKVETEITKPMEESMATLENVENITSTSSENYSMIMIEFTESANLDTVTVDILQITDTLESSWDDIVGTPYILKLNPDMLPITMTAIGMEDMEIAELSNFVNDELMNKLEGIDGVASVSASGLLEERIEIVLSEEKLEALNEKVFKGIEDQFKDTEEELAETKEDLEKSKKDAEESKNEMESNKSTIESGKSQFESGKDTFADTIVDAESQITEKQAELDEGKAEIKSQKAALEEQLEELENTEKNLSSLPDTISDLEAAEQGLTSLLAAYAEIIAAGQGMISEEDALEMLKSQVDAETAALLENQGIDGISTNLETVKNGLTELDTQLAAAGLTREDVPGALAEIAEGKAQIKVGIATMETMLEQLEEGQIQINEALKQLNSTKIKTTLDMSTAGAQLIVGESTLSMALPQIESGLEQIEAGLEQIDDGLKQIEDAKETAKESADLKGIITMDMVSMILTAQNFSMPAGQMEDDGETYTISVGDEFESIKEMENMLLFDLGLDGVDPIYLSDVADVEITDNSDEIYTKVNGNNGVILSFSKQSNGATADVSDNINDKLKELEEEYDGLSFTNLSDQGDYIYMIVETIMSNLLLGALFAVIILFIFLKDLRPTFITLCSIPISVLFALTLMYFSGVTLNMFSLSGLAVAVGMLVDNSVVVIENVYRLRHKGYSRVKAAVSGAAQVSGAVFASTLTTICVFLPIVFVDGLTRQLFMDFALTFGYALLASLIVAITLVPAMSAGLFKTKPKIHKSPVMNGLLIAYEKSIRAALKIKPVILIGAVLMLVLSVVLALAKGFTFMPDMQGDSVSVTLEMPDEEATFEEVAEQADQALEIIHEVDGVGTVGAMMSSGTSALSGLMGSTGGSGVTMYVLLDEESSRDVSDIAAEINEACSDLECEIIADAGSNMDMSALMGSGVSLNLYGEDLEQLQDTAREVAKVIETVDGIAEVDDGMDDANPGLKFIVDKTKAMENGLTVAQVYQQISAAITSEKTGTSITDNDVTYDVVVRYEDDAQTTIEDLKELELEVESTSEGFDTSDDEDEEEEKPLYITDVAEIVDTESADSISRSNQKRYMGVSAELEDGYNATLVTNDVEKALENYKLPDGVTIEFSGENETTMEAMYELLKMLGLGILLVYLVMVAQFQSLKSPFIIMFTIPLAFTGGFIALLLTGQEVSVISLIGFVMLVGIIVNNGIVLVDYINQLRQDGMEKREAMVEAGVTRMRPILMTSVTTILGLMVTAVSTGMGAEMMKPIAIVCIGGLIYATILTMYVVPCMYDIMSRKEFNKIDEEEFVITDDIDEL